MEMSLPLAGRVGLRSQVVQGRAMALVSWVTFLQQALEVPLKRSRAVTKLSLRILRNARSTEVGLAGHRPSGR